jgi:hypothetical protein
MKPRDTALRLKRFEVGEKARKVASIETMILDLEHIAADLARQIAAEGRRRQGPAHFASRRLPRPRACAPQSPDLGRGSDSSSMPRAAGRRGSAGLKLEPAETRESDRQAGARPTVAAP